MFHHPARAVGSYSSGRDGEVPLKVEGPGPTVPSLPQDLQVRSVPQNSDKLAVPVPVPDPDSLMSMLDSARDATPGD